MSFHYAGPVPPNSAYPSKNIGNLERHWKTTEIAAAPHRAAFPARRAETGAAPPPSARACPFYLEPPTMPARTPRYAAAPPFRVRDGLWAAGKSPSSRTGAQAPYRGTHRGRGSTQAVWALHADLVAAGLDRLLDIGGDAVFQLREEPVLPGDRQCQQAKVLDDVRRVGQMPILLNSTGSTAAARHRTKRLVQPGFCRVRQKQDADMGRSVLASATVSFC